MFSYLSCIHTYTYNMHCKSLSSRRVWEKFFSRKKRVDCDVRENRWQSLSDDLPRRSGGRCHTAVLSLFILALNPCALSKRNRRRKKPQIPPPTLTINIHRVNNVFTTYSVVDKKKKCQSIFINTCGVHKKLFIITAVS